MKIAICQLITPNIDAFAKYSAASLLSLAVKHGYDYFVQREKMIDDLHINWSKIKMIDKLLDLAYDYLVLFDADIILTNQEVSINHFIQEDTQTLFMPEDTHLFIKHRPNAGFIILKNDAKGKAIIKEWLQAAFDDKTLADKHPRNQRIFWKYILPKYAKDLQLISRREVSKYFYGLNRLMGNGKFAYHFDYTANKVRASFMRKELMKRDANYLRKVEALLKTKNGLISVLKEV